MKSRRQKIIQYTEEYGDIPRDYIQRLNWLCDKLKISKDAQYMSILQMRDMYMMNMYYSIYKIVLYENPEGSPRPRARLVNRSNLSNFALSDSSFIQIYSITGKADRVYMERLMKQEDFNALNNIIYTPCDVIYDAFFKTPSSFTKEEKIMAEIGILRKFSKPDWDNIGKKYSDMMNSNIWIDDKNVVSGTVNKYYSCLPRIEITLRFLNTLYTRSDYSGMCRTLDRTDLMYLHNGNLIRGD